MKNNSKTTFIIVAGIIVLVVFATVLSINLLPNYESNSYFVSDTYIIHYKYIIYL